MSYWHSFIQNQTQTFQINMQVQVEKEPQGFITPEGLQALKEYKYKPGQYTWLDYKMTPFWEGCVKLLPLWMAPNLVTFVGWLFVIASYANMLVWDYTFEKDIPSYCFFWAAFCIFVYSTLDAIDGKQARRTKTSSPLGQLFDHGCDSFSISFFILAICQATKLESTEVFLIFTASQTAFWTSNWMEYNTGVLQTSMGQFGVTEAEYLCALIHVITGVMGQNFWKIPVSVLVPAALERELGYVSDLNIGSVVVYFFSALLFLMTIYAVVRTSLASANKLKPVGEYCTLCIVLLMEYIWLNLDVYEQYNGMILVNFGVVQSLIICKMIICSVTKMKFEYFHAEIIPFLIGTILMMGLDLRNNLKGQKLLFWFVFLANLVLILKFLHSTINQITKSLGIYCFSLKKQSDPKQKSL